MSQYTVTRLEKMVHLVRDPLDVLVDRMNQYRWSDRNGTAETNTFDETEYGLSAWCSYIDARFAESEEKILYRQKLRENITQVPCYSEIIRYVQWQNTAIELSRNFPVPTLVLHYEEFSDTVSQETTTHATQQLLDFLEVNESAGASPKSSSTLFHSSKRNLFSKHVVLSMARLTKQLASPICWEYIRRYFPGDLSRNQGE